MTFPVSFSSCTRTGLSRVSAPDDGELTRADTRPPPSQVCVARQPVRLDGTLVRAAGSALARSSMLHGSGRLTPEGMSRTLPVTSLTVACVHTHGDGARNRAGGHEREPDAGTDLSAARVRLRQPPEPAESRGRSARLAEAEHAGRRDAMMSRTSSDGLPRR